MGNRNIFLEMTQLKDLTSSERQVINYILKNPQKLFDMNIVELGANSYTSASTVSRVCRKLNVDGYVEFKQKIRADLSTYQEYVYQHEYKMPTSTDNTIEEIIDRVIFNSTRALTAVKLLNSQEVFQEAIHMLEKARRIVIYGSGVSNLICHDAMIKGLRMGLNIMAYDYYSEMAMAARLSQSDDLGIIISYTGHTTEMTKISKILALNNTPSISITSNASNEIVENCRLNLYVDSTESFYRIGGVESRMSMQSILDILFTGYYNQNQIAKDSSKKSFVDDTFDMTWRDTSDFAGN